MTGSFLQIIVFLTLYTMGGKFWVKDNRGPRPGPPPPLVFAKIIYMKRLT